MFRIGVDIGGTFTDFALHDQHGKACDPQAADNTSDPARAVIEGVRRWPPTTMGSLRADVAEIVHGTTLVTNSVIERRGAKTGMLGTAGFTDIMDMGLERRYDLFDLRINLGQAIGAARPAHRGRRARAFRWQHRDAAGEDGVRGGGHFRADGIEAVAVCFLHSYANAAHELGPPKSSRSACPTSSCRPPPRCSRTCANSSAGRRLCIQRFRGPNVRHLPRAARERPWRTSGSLASSISCRQAAAC